MSKYFTISTGLRGCYMPDSCYTIRADTRRELKAIIESEADSFRNAGYIGASKRAIASLAADVWRDAGKARPATFTYCLSLAPPQAPSSYSSGIFASVATRDEWLSDQESDG